MNDYNRAKRKVLEELLKEECNKVIKDYKKIEYYLEELSYLEKVNN